MTTGANFYDGYLPQLTSYDYDAPLDEAGDPTSKYEAMQNIILKVKFLLSKNSAIITNTRHFM